MTYSVALTLVSRNGKTGPIPVSTTSKATCPPCPFEAGGCYATGGPLAIFWSKVTAGTVGTDWAGFLTSVRKLRARTLWRHNQAGDLPGSGGKIDVEALAQLVSANRGKDGFTYTHYNVTHNAANRDAVRAANAGGFTVNLSGNNLTHADALADTGAGPVVVVLPSSVSGNQKLATPAGRVVVVCPATYRDDVTCASCGLCQRQRSSIVGFPAHGVSKRRVDALVTA